MSEIKVGSRVKCVNSGSSVVAGREYTVTKMSRNGEYVDEVDGKFVGASISRFELIGGTMNVGDLVDCKDGDTKKVLLVLNQGVEIYGLSDKQGYRQGHDGFDGFYTQAELDRRGWKPKTEPQLTEKTVAELEKELGMAAGSLRVKAEDK